VVVAELCSSEGERLEYKAQESFVAPVGSNLSTPPIDYDIERAIVIESGEGEFLNLLVYVIPHTLPSTDDIYKTKPFNLNIKVQSEHDTLVNQMFSINQWSGDNISLEHIGKE
jgi:hypothetical protein